MRAARARRATRLKGGTRSTLWLTMARAAACVLLAASCVFCISCISVTPRSQTAYLRVLAEPEDVVVYVNDQFVGSARVLAVRPEPLRPGVKFVTFKAAGFFPHDLRLDLPTGTTTVRVSLRPIPP